MQMRGERGRVFHRDVGVSRDNREECVEKSESFTWRNQQDTTARHGLVSSPALTLEIPMLLQFVESRLAAWRSRRSLAFVCLILIKLTSIVGGKLSRSNDTHLRSVVKRWGFPRWRISSVSCGRSKDAVAIRLVVIRIRGAYCEQHRMPEYAGRCRLKRRVTSVTQMKQEEKAIRQCFLVIMLLSSARVDVWARPGVFQRRTIITSARRDESQYARIDV